MTLSFNLCNLTYDLVISLSGATFGFLFALWIHRKAIRKTNASKRQAEELDNYFIMEHFIAQLKDVIKFVKNQVQNFENYSFLINKSPLDLAIPNYIASQDLLRICKKDTKELLVAYIQMFEQNSESIKRYRKMFYWLDYFYFEFNEMENRIKRHINFYTNDQKLVKADLDRIPNEISKGLINMKENGISDNEFLDNILNVYYNLAQKPVSFQVYETEFLLPLHKYLFDNKLNNDFQSTAFYLSLHSLKLIKHMKYNATAHAQCVIDFNKRILDNIRNLETIYEELDKNRALTAANKAKAGSVFCGF